MTDEPGAPRVRKLPFKRTVKRKSSEDTPADANRDEDDSLGLFKRSRDFFPTVIEDQKKQAAEKAAKAEQERRDAAAAEELRKRENVKEWAEAQSEQPTILEAQQLGSSPKRRRTEPDWSDSEEEGRSSTTKVKTPSAKHSDRKMQAAILSPSAAISTSSRNQSATVHPGAPVIDLDDSDDERDEDYRPPGSRSQRNAKVTPSRMRKQTPSEEPEIILQDGPEPEEKVPDEFDIYVKRAMERAEREKATREAAANGGAGDMITKERSKVTVVKVFVTSPYDSMEVMNAILRIDQKLELMFNTFKARQPIEHEDIIFTWKGRKVWTNTTLATLGIDPDPEGHLYSRWDSKSDGFERRDGQDKVHFEAWTPNEYAEYERKKELERLKELGEIDGDFDNTGDSFPSTMAATSQQGASGPDGHETQHEQPQHDDDTRFRIILKPKQLKQQQCRVRPSTPVAMLIKVFCKMSNLPPDTKIEIHWDGEVLDPDMTIEEADIGDMDSVEVHLK